MEHESLARIGEEQHLKHHFARRGGSAVPSAACAACLLPRNPPGSGNLGRTYGQPTKQK